MQVTGYATKLWTSQKRGCDAVKFASASQRSRGKLNYRGKNAIAIAIKYRRFCALNRRWTRDSTGNASRLALPPLRSLFSSTDDTDEIPPTITHPSELSRCFPNDKIIPRVLPTPNVFAFSFRPFISQLGAMEHQQKRFPIDRRK